MTNISINPSDAKKVIDHIVAKCWADEAFKRTLIAEPKKILAEHGIQLPPDMRVAVLQESPDSRVYVIPQQADELSDVHLETVNAGASFSVFVFDTTVYVEGQKNQKKPGK